MRSTGTKSSLKGGNSASGVPVRNNGSLMRSLASRSRRDSLPTTGTPLQAGRRARAKRAADGNSSTATKISAAAKARISNRRAKPQRP